MHLVALYEVLDKPVEERQTTLDEALQQFPHVNGKLFEERIPLTNFDEGMRETLLRACRFNWSKISPAIFGSMFQSVMDPEERQAASRSPARSTRYPAKAACRALPLSSKARFP
jgi:hypothetical protein